MKTSVLFLALCSVYSVSSFADDSFNFESDNSVISVPSAVGRGSITHALNGRFAPSAPAREAHLMQVRQNMEDEILGVNAFINQGDTPPIEFVSASDVKEAYVFHTIGKGPTQSILKVANLQKGTKPGEGFLNGTLLLPASGHTGAARAMKYASSDFYSIRYSISSDARGIHFDSPYGDTVQILVNRSKSLALVTLHEVSIPVRKGHVTRIFYFREGSGGPGGYFNGRVIDFIPTDNSF